MKKVALHTLGCKLNFAETSTIGRAFRDRGFEIVGIDRPADVYVLNTCSVTERADKECRQIIRRTLRHSPEAYVIVTGCYAQLQPEEIAAIDGVDLVLGTHEKFKLFDHAGDFRKNSSTQVLVSCIDEEMTFDPAFSAEVGGRTRAFLKVQDGCDYHCAFCTIPLARGASRSQSIDAVLRQAEELAEKGFKEIVLTGVNVGDYGSKTGSSLLRLLKQLEMIDGISRIRISSIEPNLLTHELVDIALSSEKICNHFHIPLQSGSDEVLRKMRRRYSARHYRELVEYIKMKDSDAAIGADVIVGFPGETEALFEETYCFLSDLPVSYLHVFTYSGRENTPAASFDDPVDANIQFVRSERLRMLSRKKRHAFYSAFEGRTLPVLFEANDRRGTISGLTSNYIRVEVSSFRNLTNTIHEVTLNGIDDDICTGTLVLNRPNKGELLSHLQATMLSPTHDVPQVMELR